MVWPHAPSIAQTFLINHFGWRILTDPAIINTKSLLAIAVILLSHNFYNSHSVSLEITHPYLSLLLSASHLLLAVQWLPAGCPGAHTGTAHARRDWALSGQRCCSLIFISCDHSDQLQADININDSIIFLWMKVHIVLRVGGPQWQASSRWHLPIMTNVQPANSSMVKMLGHFVVKAREVLKVMRIVLRSVTQPLNIGTFNEIWSELEPISTLYCFTTL